MYKDKTMYINYSGDLFRERIMVIKVLLHGQISSTKGVLYKTT